jgi:hypothetical protein
MLPMEETLKGLTLYQIEDELSQLIEHRAERLADKEDPPSPDELAAIEGEIDRYHFAEPVKVTGVVAMFRQWRAQRANIKAESDRLKALDGMLEACETRLKDRVAAALELLPQPAKGSRKLVGMDGSQLLLKGNGGLSPLQVDGWDEERRQWLAGKPILPLELCRMEGWIRADLFELAMDLVRTESKRGTQINDYSVRLVPDNEAIRKALENPCPVCDGLGKIPFKDACIACGGSGKNTVPGARLRERGNHVEVK